MCYIQGCDGVVVSKGLCDKHRKRLFRHGTTETTTPTKWGQKEKHSLYDSWSSLKRNNKLAIEWLDFWSFVSDVKERPENTKLSRLDVDKPYSKDNYQWSVIKQKKKDFESHTEYMKQYRQNNFDIFKNIELKKRFGITLQDYQSLSKEQNYVCAICGKNETAIDSRTKKVRSLAVDHCHKTGKIRGLLCSHCNHAIGKLKDDVTLLKKAISYLEKE